MRALPAKTRRYLEKQAERTPWRLEGSSRRDLRGAVVIPSLAEGDNLFATLDSLADNPAEFCEHWLVVVVINQRIDSSEPDRQQNRHDLQRLRTYAAENPLTLAWVDATSAGRELPARKGGVGLARKLGFDLALARLDWSGQPLLAGLDADTLVEPGYLHALEDHFASNTAGAAVLPFRHQPAQQPVQQQAIDRYELFLRSYVLGLELAGSPYAFATVGSALACTAAAYVQVGGMNRRQAAEDFYFLDKLAKTAGVARLRGTCLHPSARASHRVPFGTGRSVARQLEGDAGAVRYYDVGPFLVLRRWLQTVEQQTDLSADELLASATAISLQLKDFLLINGWLQTWPRLQANHSRSAARLRAFHAWFDGLKTLRLVHHLSDTVFPRSGDPAILRPLCDARGVPFSAESPQLLERLRRIEVGER